MKEISTEYFNTSQKKGMKVRMRSIGHKERHYRSSLLVHEKERNENKIFKVHVVLIHEKNTQMQIANQLMFITKYVW
jgi:hypothetical protein